MVTLLDVVKSASSASALVSAAKAREGFQWVDKRERNKVMPWTAGRKPVIRKQAASVRERICGDAFLSRCAWLLARKKRSYAPLNKSGIYTTGDYSQLGAPQSALDAFDKVVHGGLRSLPSASQSTVGGVVRRFAPRINGIRADAAQRKYNDATSWGNFFRSFIDRGARDRFTTAVDNRYAAMTPVQQAVSNLGSGVELGLYGVGGPGWSGAAKGIGAGVAGDLGVGAAEGALGVDAPSSTDKIMRLILGQHELVDNFAEHGWEYPKEVARSLF